MSRIYKLHSFELYKIGEEVYSLSEIEEFIRMVKEGETNNQRWFSHHLILYFGGTIIWTKTLKNI